MSSRNRRWLRIGRVLIAAVTAVIAIAALGLWWLTRHPVSVDFLAPRIEAALADQIAPLTAEIEGLGLGWSGWGTPLELRAYDSHILDDRGRQLVEVNQLGIDLSAPSLLQGEVQIEALTLIDLRWSIVRQPDGRFDLGLPADLLRSDEDPGREPPTSLGGWLETLGIEELLDRLGRIEMRNIEIVVEDRRLDLTWGGDQIVARLERTDHGIEGEWDSRLRVADDTAKLSTAATFDSANRVLTGRLEIADFPLSALSALFPESPIQSDSDRQVEGSIEAQLTDQLDLRDTRVQVNSDWGSLSTTIDYAHSSKDLSAEIELEQIRPSLIAQDVTKLEELEGVRLPLDATATLKLADGEIQTLDLELTSKDGVLTTDLLPGEGLEIGSVELSARAEDGLQSIAIENARIELRGGPTVTAEATARRTKNGYRLSLGADLDEIDVARLGDYWPIGTAAQVEEWIASHIPAGSIHDLRLDLAADRIGGDSVQLALRDLTGSFDFQNLQLDLFPPQPAVSEVDGRATFSTKGFEFDVERGRLVDLDVGPSLVTIDGLDHGSPALSFEVSLSGPAATVIETVAEEPLSLIPPESLSGLTAQVASTLQMEIPLAGSITFETMDLAARGELSEIAWPDAPWSMEISQGTATFDLDKQSLGIDGEVNLSDVPVTFGYSEFFGDGDLRRQIEASATLSPASARQLGLPEQDYISGIAQVEFGVAIGRHGGTRIDLDADLTDSQLAVPQIAWDKAPGEMGKISAHVEKTGSGWRVERFDLQTHDLTATGELELASEPPGLIRADLEHLQFGASRLKGSVVKDTGPTYAIDIQAPLIEAAPLIKGWRASSESKERGGDASVGPAAVGISATVDELVLTPDVRIMNLGLQAEHDGQRWKDVDVEAMGGSDHRIEVRLTSSGEGRQVEMTTDDLGNLTKLIDATNRVDGGHLEITGTSGSGEDQWEGILVAGDFTVKTHRWFASLLELGTFQGLLNNMNAEGLEIRRVDANLSGTPQRIEIGSSLVQGHGFGVTTAGWIDFAGGSLDLTGSLYSARAIRKVVGKIPVVKQILFGSTHDKGFATKFRVSGPFDDVQTDVNPISTLTPAITNEITDLFTKKSNEEND